MEESFVRPHAEEGRWKRQKLIMALEVWPRGSAARSGRWNPPTAPDQRPRLRRELGGDYSGQGQQTDPEIHKKSVKKRNQVGGSSCKGISPNTCSNFFDDDEDAETCEKAATPQKGCTSAEDATDQEVASYIRVAPLPLASWECP